MMNARPSQSLGWLRSGTTWLLAAAGVTVILSVAFLGVRSVRQGRKIELLERQLSAIGDRGPLDKVSLSQLEGRLSSAFLATASQLPTTPVDCGSVAPPQRAETPPALTDREIHLRYEDLFRGENVNARWAETAQQMLGAKLPSSLPVGSTTLRFECRASMCRIETSHASSDARASFLEALVFNESERVWNAASYSAPLNDDQPDGPMVTYLSRDGQPLPDPGSELSKTGPG